MMNCRSGAKAQQLASMRSCKSRRTLANSSPIRTGLGANEVEKLKQTRVILCREVEFNYDRDPYALALAYYFIDAIRPHQI